MVSTLEDFDIEAVDEVVEDLNEQMEIVQEIDEVISQPIGLPMNDEELEAELAEIEFMAKEEDQQKMRQIPYPMKLNVEKRNQGVPDMEEDDFDAELASLDSMVMPKTKELMTLSQCPRCV